MEEAWSFGRFGFDFFEIVLLSYAYGVYSDFSAIFLLMVCLGILLGSKYSSSLCLVLLEKVA